ncbi:MAG: hypothetical protein HY259_06140 [Chloroflexi bacterium]|nr:hypothetical protein [Chloroflexota bacterium]MBI3733024.1 hypothetical protein [Chloroflexota bacterium]
MPAFDLSALRLLFVVALLDSMLSVDNALVLAVVVEHLPPPQQGRALQIGIFLAYLLRALSIFVASFLVTFWPLKLLGALYLLWLGLSHLLEKNQEEEGKPKRKQAGYWLTIAQVGWLDLTFSLDNILATVALTTNTFLIIVAVSISILALRFAAGGFLKLLGYFPILRTTAYLIVIFIGAKLLASLPQIGYEIPDVESFAVILGIIVISLAYERVQKAIAARAASSKSSTSSSSES